MPALRITKNGEPLCTVGSDDVWMFSASLWSDIWGPEVSTLTVTGSGKPDARDAREFLVWELSHELKASDRLTFSFEAGSNSSPTNQVTFDPSDSDEQNADYVGFIPGSEFASIEARPKENLTCHWSFAVTARSSLLVAPDETRQHIGLQVLWNDHRPETLRVHLSKSSVREIAERSAGEELFLEYLPLGTEFEVEIGI
jgi:hypothetical protein